MINRTPQGPPCPHISGGDEEEWLAMHMGHRHKQNMRQRLGSAMPGLSLLPAQIQRDPEIPPAQGTASSQPFSCTDQ